MDNINEYNLAKFILFLIDVLLLYCSPKVLYYSFNRACVTLAKILTAFTD